MGDTASAIFLSSWRADQTETAGHSGRDGPSFSLLNVPRATRSSAQRTGELVGTHEYTGRSR